MSENLKPCPFCGREDKWQSIDVGILPDHIDPFQFTRGERYVTVTLTCKHCGATIQGYSATVGETIDDLQRRVDVAVNDAHVAWNTRAERTCANIWDKEPEPKCDNGFKCSLCGYSVSDGEDWRVFTYEHEENGCVPWDCVPWRYCPGCGAKVIT